MRRRLAAVCALVALGMVATGCDPAPPAPSSAAPTTAQAPNTGSPVEVPTPSSAPLAWPAGSLDEPLVLATGLEAPWSITFADDAAFVSERDSGRVLELVPGGSVREVGVVPQVVHGGEGGLLGLAARDGWLYAYSTGDGGNRIQRFELYGSAGTYELGAPQDLLTGIPASRTHNGGRLAFGPDGMLYGSTGDAGDRAAAQDRGSLAGKILRIAPDGSVPDDNPFGSAVWTLGHRNVQGLAWGDDGTMYASEFGQDTWDELNVIRAGANYGWPEAEGTEGSDDARFTAPIMTWPTDEASPSGLAFAGGVLSLAALRGERLIRVPTAGGAAAPVWEARFGRLRDVVRAPDGAVLVLTSNTDGRGSPFDGDDRILAFRP